MRFTRSISLVSFACAGLSSILARGATQSSQPATGELPATCYLFAFFYHHLQGEGLRLAWSRDGLAWELLRNGESFLRPAVGEAKLMRDPCLVRGPDGLFHLVWTTAWQGKTIGHASSRDLITWSEQQAIPVMAHEPDAKNCWAPELIWDQQRQHFLVHWSTTIIGRFAETANTNRRPESNHRIYATTTTDFVTFTPTRLLYDGGFNVIDATLAPDGANGWLMFVKNEQLTPVLEKNIRMVRAPTAEGPFGPVSARITGDYWAEGPSALKIGDAWHVYFDKHRLNRIGLVRSRDLVTWEDASDQVHFPKDARHGTVLAVPVDVVRPLLEIPPSS
jgi:hypothetical protein